MSEQETMKVDVALPIEATDEVVLKVGNASYRPNPTEDTYNPNPPAMPGAERKGSLSAATDLTAGSPAHSAPGVIHLGREPVPDLCSCTELRKALRIRYCNAVNQIVELQTRIACLEIENAQLRKAKA